jgi:hypothetical protein
MIHRRNIAINRTAVEFLLETPYVVLVDPLLIEALLPRVTRLLSSPSLPTLPGLVTCLRKAHPCMSVGVYAVSGFQPGWYQLELTNILRAAADAAATDLVDVDSGTIVLADYAHLEAICTHLNWKAYDLALRCRDDQEFFNIEKRIGGPFYAVASGCSGLGEFEGDGRYRIKPGSLVFNEPRI